MPKIFKWKGYRFHFFSNEGDPLEPIHIHVQKGVCRAKFQIDPEICLVSNFGFNSHELNEFENKIREEADLIRRKWNEYFNN
ncbi:MAG: DUF4160 domain-containing protein [Candidatus Aureabacteria bacterium]|nr:DUF4160 domain-containing protein [Candidatus Auribacterota bacterium]